MEYRLDNGRGLVWRERDLRDGTLFWCYTRRLKDGTYGMGKKAMTRTSAIDSCWELINEKEKRNNDHV